ncbi:hypothetical protein H4R33_004202 [Dimargaris cristalligena]|nr:hypothetical protein H4R33_004202 [Dimargaris cristalligena]
MASTQAPPEGSAHSHRPYANPIDPSLSPDKLAQLNPLHNAFAGSSALLQDPANAALLQNGGLGYSQGYYTSDPGLYTGQSASRGLFNYAGIRFLTVALSNPFEVGQTLLQVQHLPSDTELTVDGVAALPESTGGRDGGFDRHHVPGPEDPGYYEYLRNNPPSASGTPLSHASLTHGRRRGTPRTDHTGYFVPSVSTLDDDGTRAAYELGILETGVWGTMRRLYNHPQEGLLSLFKGQFTGWVWEMAQLFIQPTLEGYLNEMFNLYDDTIPLMHLDHVWPNLSTLIASNVITGVALSPLELVRTRLMLQPGQTNRQKYSGLFNGLSTIMREEGGLWAMYFSTVHLIPTVVFHSLRPLFENTGSLVVNRALGISSEDTPFTSAVAHMAYSMLELLVVLPVETVRKRLQAQPRYTKEFMLTVTADQRARSASGSGSNNGSGGAAADFRPYMTSVPITPVPYTGMLNCAYRIITEEGRSAKQIRAARKAMDPSLNSSNNSGRHDPLQEHDGGASRFNRRRPTSATPLPVTWGLRGLYQGFGLHCTSHVALFLVNLVGPITVEEDW